MRDKEKTNEQLLDELTEMRQRIAELESAEAKLRQVDEALKQYAARLALLNDISGKITVVLDVDSVLEKATVSLVHEGFGYHRVGLFILDRERGELVMRTRAGDFANLLPPDHHRLKLKQGMVGRAAYYGKSLLANDVDAEPRYVNPYPDVIPPRSELSVPIGMGGEVVGVLDIQSSQRNAFSEGDMLMMEALADQIAAVMRNAQLYDAAQQELAKRKRIEESLREARDELEDRVEGRTAELSEINERLREESAQRARMETIWRGLQQLGTKLAHLRDEEMILEAATKDLNNLGLFSILFKLDDSGQRLRIAGITAWSAIRRAKRSIIGLHREDISLSREQMPAFAGVLDRGELLYLTDFLQQMEEQKEFIPGWDRFLPYLIEKLRLPGRGILAPLVVGEEPIGLLAVSSHELSETYVPIIGAFARTMSAAVENARLYEQAQQEIAERVQLEEQLAAIYKLGQELTLLRDEDVIPHRVLEVADAVLQFDLVGYGLVDEAAGELVYCYYMAGGAPKAVNLHLPLGGERGIGAAVVRDRQPLIVADTLQDARYVPITGNRIRSEVCVPMKVGERVFGVLSAESVELNHFTPADQQLLQILAVQAAVALENARLYEELKAMLRQREETQAQLIHVEKMGALGRLVASIAHEINNPLQSVQGCLTLTVEELDGPQRREKLDRYLGVARSEIERISAIVQRMRDLYRPTREGKQPTDLHAILESVLALTNKQLQHSNVAVERAWREELPVIQANADQLKQVFLNLILNAIDAMPGGGPLRISTNLDEVEIRDGQAAVPAVRVEFSDAGEGISEDMLPHIFEPFFTTKENGAGLGLSISYGIIESHNGQMAVTSEAGVGTTFTILLPVKQP